MNVRIGNIARGDRQGEYIGRDYRGHKASPLGNPFSVQEHGRDGCIAEYHKWLRAKVDAKDTTVMNELYRLLILAKRPQGVKLLCWCFPKLCHGLVIKGALTWLENDDPLLAELFVAFPRMEITQFTQEEA